MFSGKILPLLVPFGIGAALGLSAWYENPSHEDDADKEEVYMYTSLSILFQRKHRRIISFMYRNVTAFVCVLCFRARLGNMGG